MQEPFDADDARPSRLCNPLLDVAVAGGEAQLKAWQAYQVEGTRFVAKRMRANLEFLRALGHCGEVQSMGECQWAWLRDVRKDYAEEWSRIVGTTFALGFTDLAAMGGIIGQRTAQASPQSQPEPQSKPQSPPQVQSRLPAAA